MQSRLIILALAAALTVPTLATASWGAKGSLEPDTSLDASGLFMETDPDTKPVGPGIPQPPRVVYFNGFQGTGYTAGVTSINPNSAAVGSSVLLPTELNIQALLGVWKDCNKDGYMGWGDNALLEYRSELLALPNMDGEIAGTSVCGVEPIGPVPKASGDHTGYQSHNDGKWVREFLPIGPENTLPGSRDQNPFNIPDSTTHVWADWGTPGAPPGFICWLSAHPRDSTHSVGGMVDIVDCYSRGRINATLGSNPTLWQTWIDNRGDDPRDANSDCDASHLGNLPSSYKRGCQPWGYEDDGAFVDITSDQNCNSPIVNRQVTQDKQVRVPMPSPTTGGAQPSIAGTVYQLDNDVSDCNRDDGSEWNLEDTPYQTEDDLLNQNAGRIVNDFVLPFVEELRPGAATALTGTLGGGTSRHMGTHPTPEGIYASNSLSTYAHNSVFNIDTLGVREVRHITYYARVGAVAISAYSLMLPGSTGIYGSEACGTAIGPGQPDKNFWKCDPELWWPQTVEEMRANGVGLGTFDGYEDFAGAHVGDTYNVRDVDCYDTSVTALRDEGVSWGVLTQTACA